jgi:hypothetical protein
MDGVGVKVGVGVCVRECTEAESKEKHGLWDPTMPEMTRTSPYDHFRVDRLQHIYHGQPSESTLSISQGPRIKPQIIVIL